MSVSYNAYIGLGYIISQAERDFMVAAADEKDIDVESHIYCIDAYREDPNYFFGEILKSAEEGSATSLNQVLCDVDGDKFCETYEPIISACGIDIFASEAWLTPQIYIIHSVT